MTRCVCVLWAELFSPFGQAEGNKCDNVTSLAPNLPLPAFGNVNHHRYSHDPGRPNRVSGPLHLDLLTR